MSLPQFDFLIVGSGFGGSVSAMRLAQKGYSVAILEKGKRFRKNDFPLTNWTIHKFLWAPLIRCFGIQQITLLKGVMVLHGAGVGGGSLVYANTLMKPHDDVFSDPHWPTGQNWKQELSSHYQMAQRMLGVTLNKFESEADLLIRNLGRELGVENTYHATEVGIYFGAAGKETSDPYFNGAGPHRTGCTGCGACMIGCRVGAKNTLDQNYLYFAEKWGAQIFPEIHVDRIQPIQSTTGARYEVCAYSSTRFLKKKFSFHAKNVIFSAGVMGTVDLLFRNKEVYQTLPEISDTLGDLVRTNGESLCGATSFDAHRDLSKGIAIGSAIHPDAQTKIEPVRYPAGSDVMKFLAVPLTNDGTWLTRPLKLIKNMFFQFPQFLRLYLVKDWASKTIIVLVMQTIDRQMRLRMGRSIFQLFRLGLVGRATDKPIPSFIPIAQTASEKLARSMNGIPQNGASEVLLGTPATAHILGGCCMADHRDRGVINNQHEIFGYPGLYVCDGSVIPANLGVNPSLTITALSERFASQFPDQLTAKDLPQRQIRFTVERI